MKDCEEKNEVAEFQIGDLLGIGITFVVLVVALAFGLDLVEDTQDDLVTNVSGCNATSKTHCPASYNATGDGITAISKITGKLGMIAGAVVISIVIGVLVRYLYNAGTR